MARIPQVKYKVNLETLFGGRMRLNTATREAIGQAIIDKIVERTSERHIDKFGKSMGSYSKSYKDSLAFKVTKPGQSQVNLTQTGDMLGSLTIIETTPGTITIGFTESRENAKAYGHISGMEGHPVLEGKVRARDFLGLPKSELEAIASQFEDQVRAIDRIESAESREDLDRATVDLIAEIEAEIEGES